MVRWNTASCSEDHWSSRPIELGVEVQYSTLDTVAVIVDCGSHYIQYHAILN